MRLYATSALLTSLAISTAASAATTSYADRTSFLAANPLVVTENFEAAQLASGAATGFAGPLNAGTNNAIFAANSIKPGFTINTTQPDGSAGSNATFASRDYAGNATAVVSSNYFAENLRIDFTSGVTAFAVDLAGFGSNNGSWTVTLLSALGQQGTFSLASGGFFGVRSTVALTGVYLDKPDTGGVIDNLSFGASGAVPEPATWTFLIGGFGMLGGAMRRRKLTVKTV